MKKKVKEETKKEEPKVEQKHVCDVCGEDAVVRDGIDAHYYCYKHHMYWTQCKTHEWMVADHKKS